MNLVFLGSGGGGNLKFIHLLEPYTGFSVKAVVTDRDCGALNYAEQRSIENYIHSFKRNDSENQKLVHLLSTLGADVVITNVHKILSESVIESVQSRFINLHYSYLPAYRGFIGMKPLLEAIYRDNSYAGVTCHDVVKEVDEGKTLAQAFFPILNKTQTENIQTCFEAGAIALLAGLERIHKKNTINNEFTYKDIKVNPGQSKVSVDMLEGVFNELATL